MEEKTGDRQGIQPIRSGFYHFYSHAIAPSALVYFNMVDPVDTALLQKALDRAIVRYPYFRVKLVWKDDDIYLTQNDAPLIVAESKDMRPLGSKEVNFHLLEVHVSGRTVFVHWHHGIADGNGIYPFVRTFLYCYLCEYYGRDFVVPNLIRPDSPVDPREYDEPCGDEPFPSVHDEPVRFPDRRYSLPEYGDEEQDGFYHTRIGFPMKQFVRFMKGNDSSPATMLCLFMCQAIDRLHPKHDGVIGANLIWNFRSQIGMPKTHNNCVTFVNLIYQEGMKSMPLDLQGTCFRGQVFVQSSDGNAIEDANLAISVRTAMDAAGGFDAKYAYLGFLDDLADDTFSLSYTGQTGLGECEQMIESSGIVVGGNDNIIMEVASTGDTLGIDFMMKNDVQCYLDAFCERLAEEGVQYKRLPTEKISFPDTSLSIMQNAKKYNCI